MCKLIEKALCGNEKSVLYADLVKLIVEISDYILESEETIMKGASEAMGGKVLELESERLKKEGESLLGSLITMLLSAGRNSDVALAAKDEEARKKFYKEFGLID